jgi:hypothetical protein
MSVARGLMFGVTAVMKPMRVKTAASFTTEDPWNLGRRSAFRLNEYLLLFSNAKVTELTKATGSDFKRALLSEADNVEHWLPDSLSELWRSKQVSAEALLRLLKEAEPTLKQDDYAIILRNKARTLLAGLSTLICLGFMVFVGIGMANDNLGLVPILVGEFVLAGGCWLGLYFRYYRAWFRRKSQMKWFLERANTA